MSRSAVAGVLAALAAACSRSAAAPAPREAAVAAAWDAGLGSRVEALARDGRELAVLEPIAERPELALPLLEHLRGSDRLWDRKLAAILAGRLGPAAPAGTLEALFEGEAARGRRPGSDRLDPQSVVEDVVGAAVAWCGHPDRRDAGIAVLRRVVERTIGGEYWNSSHPALKGLACDCRADARELVARYAAWSGRPPPVAPSRPSLDAERRFANAVGAGRCDGLWSFGSARVPADGLDAPARRELERFLEIARVAR